MRWEGEWKIVQRVDSMDLVEIWFKNITRDDSGSHMQSCLQSNIGGGRQLRLGGHMTTTTQQLGGVWGHTPKKFL